MANDFIEIFCRVRAMCEFGKCSAVAETGDRLATIDMGRKLGGCAPFFLGGGAGSHLVHCGLSRGLPPYQVSS